jgi:YhcH/YjgK/YiaL family protein
MILDKLENCSRYSPLNLLFEKAFRFLAAPGLDGLEDGKYPIDGENVFALVQSYTTSNSSAKKWEAHRKYIDIQYVVKGNEIDEWAPASGLNVLEEYTAEKDVAFFGETDEWTSVKLKEGYFAVFFPEDAHKPGCTSSKEARVKKVVVKVKI